MPDFKEPVSEQLRREVLETVTGLIQTSPEADEVTAEDYVLEPAAAVVLDHLLIPTRDGDVDLNLCRPGWSPPFEWLAEITSSLPGADYFKHYLVRNNDIVLAHRRELTVIDDAEARRILADLRLASQYLA